MIIFIPYIIRTFLPFYYEWLFVFSNDFTGFFYLLLFTILLVGKDYWLSFLLIVITSYLLWDNYLLLFFTILFFIIMIYYLFGYHNFFYK